MEPLTEDSWRLLVRRINDGLCTPFLGAGVNDGILPLGGEIAETWASEKGYPLPDRKNLPRVAQYRALTDPDRMTCKEDLLRRWFRQLQLPPKKKKDEEDHPLRLLASLPAPVYLTTNYDDLLKLALKDEGKDARQELCKWNQHSNVKSWRSVWKLNPAFMPDKNNPVIFHLHGMAPIYESLVLTEDDYLDFLATISKQGQEGRRSLLPARIKEALSGSSILFVGYSLEDWTFRVLFRGLINQAESGLRRVSVAVQLPPQNDPDRVQKYLSAYFKNMEVRCYWGTAQEFMVELKRRMEEYGDD